MTRIRKIVYGTTEIDLLDTAAGFHITSKQDKLAYKDFRSPAGFLTQRVMLNLIGTDVDDVAEKIDELIRVMSAAEDYFDEKTTTPVYLMEQLEGETNPRYALIRGAAELGVPDLWTSLLELHAYIADNGLVIIFKTPWSSHPPAELPDEPLTLIGSTRVSGEESIVTELEELQQSTKHFAYNGATYVDFTNTSDYELFSNGDYWYIMGTRFPRYTGFLLKTAGQFNGCTFSLRYYSSAGGGSWKLYGLADDYQEAEFPQGLQVPAWDSFAYMLGTAGPKCIGIKPPSDAATVTLNGFTGYALQILKLTGTIPVKPVVDGKMHSEVFNYIEIDENAIAGDATPELLLRMMTPKYHPSVNTLGIVHKVIVAAKEVVENIYDADFYSVIPAGNSPHPNYWTNIYGTDTASQTNLNGDKHVSALCDFATDASLKTRVRIVGENQVLVYKGQYSVRAKVRQIGGNAGDVRLSLRVSMGGAAEDGFPSIDFPVVETQIGDNSTPPYKLEWEWLNLTGSSYLNIPFMAASALDSYGGVDLYIDLLAERVTGTAELEICSIDFIPTDVCIVEMRDTLLDRVWYTSALRGEGMLDLDGGVIKSRCVKYVGNDEQTMNDKFASGKFNASSRLYLKPRTPYKIYIYQASFTPTFTNEECVIKRVPHHFVVKMYAKTGHRVLRGGA